MSSSVDKYYDMIESGGWVSDSTGSIEEPIKDQIVEQVKDLFDARSKVGIEKYNTTLYDSPDGFYKFLQHLQEEMMDGVLYIQKLKQQK